MTGGMLVNVLLYSNHCPCCRVQQTLLDRNGISYDVETDIEKMLALGMTHLPMLRVDGNPMNYQAALLWLKERTHSHESR